MQVNLVDSTDVILARLNKALLFCVFLGPEYRWLLADLPVLPFVFFNPPRLKVNEEQAYHDAIENIAIHREIGDRWQAADGLRCLGCIHAFRGEKKQAKANSSPKHSRFR